MCNLYSHTRNVEAIRKLFAKFDSAGVNMPPQPGIYPDYQAPIVRNEQAGQRLAMTRWGMPSSKKALLDAATKRADKLRAKGKDVDFDWLLRMEPDGGTTNVRNTASSHWKRWLGVENRCLVPFNSFAEPGPGGTTGSPSARSARRHSSPASGARNGPACARSRPARRRSTSMHS